MWTHDDRRTSVSEGALSVVVPTRDRPELLAGCLASIRRSIRAADEIIVVDSASTQAAGVREVASEHGAAYVRCERPGASRARNIGWRHAAYDLIAFVDDDVRLEDTWAKALADSFTRFPEAAFITGQVGVPSGDDPEYPVALIVDPEPFWYDRDTRRDPGHSANVTVRRLALAAVGGFDEALGAGAKFKASEDKDLFDRLVAAGFRGRYEPSAAAVHVPWRTRSDILRMSWSYGLGTGVRIVKLLKTDRARARGAAYDAFWGWGLLYIWSYARSRLKFLTLVSTVRLVGMVVGLVWGSPRKVHDGHFRVGKKP